MVLGEKLALMSSEVSPSLKDSDSQWLWSSSSSILTWLASTHNCFFSENLVSARSVTVSSPWVHYHLSAASLKRIRAGGAWAESRPHLTCVIGHLRADRPEECRPDRFLCIPVRPTPHLVLPWWATCQVPVLEQILGESCWLENHSRRPLKALTSPAFPLFLMD